MGPTAYEGLKPCARPQVSRGCSPFLLFFAMLTPSAQEPTTWRDMINFSNNLRLDDSCLYSLLPGHPPLSVPPFSLFTMGGMFTKGIASFWNDRETVFLKILWTDWSGLFAACWQISTYPLYERTALKSKRQKLKKPNKKNIKQLLLFRDSMLIFFPIGGKKKHHIVFWIDIFTVLRIWTQTTFSQQVPRIPEWWIFLDWKIFYADFSLLKTSGTERSCHSLYHSTVGIRNSWVSSWETK
jgi:hypothetical protein